MKIDCGPTWQEKKERWSRWFAWHPVRVGPHDCRWLEYVERRFYKDYEGYFPVYRIIGRPELEAAE